MRTSQDTAFGHAGARCLCLNTQGAPGCWRLHEEKFLGSQIVALQEVCMDSREWEGFANHCSLKGYKSFYTPGEFGSSRQLGGVALLIHKSVKHHFAESITHFGVQIQSVWVHGVRIINVYSPPNHSQVTIEALGMFWEAHQVNNHDWIIMGDFNEEPNDTSIIFSLLSTFGGRLSGDGLEATRWQGNKCIDWCMHSLRTSTEVIFRGVQNEVVFSDHKGIWLEMSFVLGSSWRGRLKPSPIWSKPSSLAAEDWIQQLEMSWKNVEQSNSYQQLMQSVRHSEPSAQGIVQKEWDLYMDCLHLCFQHGLETLSCEGQTREIQNENFRLLKQSGKSAKGAVAKHQWVRDSTLVKGNPSPGEGLRGLRRKLARAFEIRRCCKRLIRPPEELLTKVCPHMRHASNAHILAHVETVIEDVHSQQHALEVSNYHNRLQAWQRRVNTGTFKQLGRWIRSKESNLKSFQLYDNHGLAQSREEATKKIFEHQVRLQESQTVNVEQASQFLTTWFGQHAVFPQSGVCFSTLWKIIRNGDGAAGPDGWSANELRFLPLPAIRVWDTLGHRWIAAGTVPQQLTEVRQVNLPKLHKIDQNGRLAVQGLRPISILSAFWRLWASAFIKDDSVSQWISRHKHPDIIHGRQSLGCETAAQLLQDSYVNDQYICSLDYQEAYDRMHPAVTSQFLHALGWPGGFCQVLHQVWGNQRRFVQFENHTHDQVLPVSSSTPQGCPLAPAILALWLSSGVRFLSHLVGQVPGCLVVYVDDRTFTSRSWSHMESLIQGWRQVSDTLGLVESRGKTQVAAKGRQQQATLRSNASQDWIKQEVKFLGCNTTSQPRQNVSEEDKRINSALTRANLLGCTGMAWNRLVSAYRCFVISKFGYGWVSRAPTSGVSKKFFTRLSGILRTNRNSSPWLRRVLYGANIDYECIFIINLWNRINKLINHDLRPNWRCKPHTGLHLLRRALKNWGWCEDSPWLWRKIPLWNDNSPAEARRLDLRRGSHQTLEVQQHNIRFAYKQVCFGKFLDQNRRENRGWSFDRSRLVRAFGQIDLTETWKTLQSSCAAGRAVLLGSFRTPMCNHQSDAACSPVCPHCGHHTANHEHLFWMCPALNPSGIRKPSNPLQERFGWFSRFPDHNGISSLEYFTHMTNVVSHTWNMLHDS